MNPALIMLRQMNQEINLAMANSATMNMVDKMLNDRGIVDEGKEEETGWCIQCSGSGEGQYDGSCCPVCKGKGE